MSETMEHPIGELFPYAVFLGTGYGRFESPFGIHGLARIKTPGKLELLAVAANEQGKGNFRKFIAACKECYDCICIWECWNPLLDEILPRYNFWHAQQIDNDGERVKGWRWSKAREKTL